MKKIELMSRTVDSWKPTESPRKPHDSPTLTPEQIKAVQKRISNWDRKNF